MLQRHAIQELHNDERQTVLLIDFMNGANVGMIKRRSRLCLSLKTGESLRIPGDVVGQKFHCDKAEQSEVFGLVNDTHTAAAKLFEDAVMRNGLSNERVSGGPEGV